MRWLYSLAWLIGLPFAFLYLAWRARRQPEYLRHWGERLGLVALRFDRPVIWLHAVSVGETHAAAPLVRALQAAHPDHALLLTHTTPTGRAAGQALFGDAVHQAYLPYDLPWAVAIFLRRVRPRLGVVMETEVWPNLFAACRARGVPLFLVNARLSARSAAGYGRVAALVRPALRSLAGVAAQTPADAERLQALGADAVTVTGNLKFDIAAAGDTAERAAQLREALGSRPVFLAASTREGEEPLILEAFERLGPTQWLLAIVPRHPQRFDEVAALLAQRGLGFQRRSSGQACGAQDRVFLGDSMGEMAAYYAACDIAFVGGSLLPLGGQNLIEAAAAGRPVLIGPHTWNFAQAADQAVAAGAALRVQDPEELTEMLRWLMERPEARAAMGAAGRAFAQAHRGATERVLALIEPALIP